MPDAWAYRHRLSVRFRDCDAMGHVNHAVYFTESRSQREMAGADPDYNGDMVTIFGKDT